MEEEGVRERLVQVEADSSLVLVNDMLDDSLMPAT